MGMKQLNPIFPKINLKLNKKYFHQIKFRIKIPKQLLIIIALRMIRKKKER